MKKHKFKKKYGQNFLVDKNIISKIVDFFDLNKEDLVIEIGPGSGALTRKLANKTQVLAYEIDGELKSKLIDLEKKENVTIIWDDFLKRNIKDDIGQIKYNSMYVIANLPYYITTPIIEKIINEKINISKMLIMVQKEVADRFSAVPGTKQYGSLTVFLNCYFNINQEIVVKKDSFYPKPKVESVVLSLDKKKVLSTILDKTKFDKLIYDSFKYKRKNLKNNLINYDLKKIEKVLIKHNLSLLKRAEELPLQVFIEIANNL